MVRMASQGQMLQSCPCQKRERAVFHSVMFVFIDYISAQ